jgi:hypothetical protein
LGDTFGSVSFGKIDNKYLENPSDPIAYAALTEEYYWSIRYSIFLFIFKFL